LRMPDGEAGKRTRAVYDTRMIVTMRARRGAEIGIARARGDHAPTVKTAKR